LINITVFVLESRGEQVDCDSGCLATKQLSYRRIY